MPVLRALLLISAAHLVRIDARPLRAEPIVPTDEQFAFMRRFGYLEAAQPGLEAQYSSRTIRDAVLEIQRFGGIPRTGIFDRETLKLMKRKRCGVKDVHSNSGRSRRYILVGHGWRKLNLTYHIGNWNLKLGEYTVKSQIERALNMWEKNGNISFTSVNHNNSNIKFSFHAEDHGDSFPFDGLGGVLGHAFFPFTKYGGTVHFDDDENWDLTADFDRETTGFFLVAVHELGHALGIGHSDVPTAIMFPYHSDADPEDLDQDDIEALNKLYSPEVINSHNRNVASTTEYSTSTVTNSLAQSTHTVNQEDICQGFDTLAVLRKDLFVFKGQDVWRFSKRGFLNEGYPVKLYKEFPGLPSTIEKVNAVYEKYNGSIVFFSGNRYWCQTAEGTEGPNSMMDYQLNEGTSINAALLWPNNERTYLFKNNIFWRFDEMRNTLDDNYPKNMVRWRGIPSDVTAAINWDGSTYFFRDLLFWKFNNRLIKADKRQPLPTPQIWFGCPEDEELFKRISHH